MNDELMKITPMPIPFNEDDKIFLSTDEDGNIIGEPFSYNDFIKKINDLCGVEEDLLGKRKKEQKNEI